MLRPREVLSEIHLLRAVPRARQRTRASKGLHDKDGAVQRQPARHQSRRAAPPRREDLGDARRLRKAGDAVRRRLALVIVDKPRCAPAPGHRICKRLHEVVHLPEAGGRSTSRQIETGVLTDVLAMPFRRSRIYGPCSRAGTRSTCAGPVRAGPYQTAKKRGLVVGLGPAGYNAGALPGERRVRRGSASTGLKIEPLARRPSTGTETAAPRARFATGGEIYRPLDQPRARGVRRRVGVRRHHRSGGTRTFLTLPAPLTLGAAARASRM